MDKNTKILITEIPGAWTERSRSGHTNIWNSMSHDRPHSNGLPEVRLEPPEKGLYAERIDNAWYWVSGCRKCSGDHDGSGYIVCDKHNVCEGCGTHRSKLTETPYGVRNGFLCVPCNDLQRAAEKASALAKVAESPYDEWDYRAQDQCKCPHCASVIHIESDDHQDKNMSCDVCEGEFELSLEYSVSYTTKVIGERITA
ncbi:MULTISPECIES: hypothetical protein [Pseudomonas]|uniref:hypothetical protein n=1 Tax=Pseudomonas TaxID=286 RepID=UPI003A8C3DBD